MGGCISTGKRVDNAPGRIRTPTKSPSVTSVRSSSRERLRKSIDYAGTQIISGLQTVKPVAIQVKSRATKLKRMSQDFGNLIIHRKPISQDLEYGMRKVQQNYAPFGKRKSDPQEKKVQTQSDSTITSSIQISTENPHNSVSTEGSEKEHQPHCSDGETNLATAADMCESNTVVNDPHTVVNDPHRLNVSKPRYSGPEPLILSDVSDEEQLTADRVQEARMPAATSKKPRKRLPRRFGADEDSIEPEALAAGLKHHFYAESSKKREHMNPSKKVEKVLTRIMDGKESVNFSQRAAVHRF
jgi:hypothetical protein